MSWSTFTMLSSIWPRLPILKNWKLSEKKKWIQKHRRMLLKGQTDQMIAAIKILCRGRNSKDITTERNYFIRNQHRMKYQPIADLKLPIGSGAMESAIRRVVNLRLKGASIVFIIFLRKGQIYDSVSTA
jgi:hypothetical protein